MPDEPTASCTTSIPPAARTVWRIEGPLVISTVTERHRQLDEQLAAARELTLDLGGLTALDVFGVQLLWSARNTAAARGQLLTFAAAPAVFGEACAASGFPPSAFLTP